MIGAERGLEERQRLVEQRQRGGIVVRCDLDVGGAGEQPGEQGVTFEPAGPHDHQRPAIAVARVLERTSAPLRDAEVGQCGREHGMVCAQQSLAQRDDGHQVLAGGLVVAAGQLDRREVVERHRDPRVLVPVAVLEERQRGVQVLAGGVEFAEAALDVAEVVEQHAQVAIGVAHGRCVASHRLLRRCAGLREAIREGQGRRQHRRQS